MALESNIGALWGAKQTAKGTPVAGVASSRRFNWVAGDLNSSRSDGSENISDLSRFGDATDYVDTLIGEGSIGIQATPTETAWLAWMFFGQETVTGAADPWSHVATPSAAGGFWATFWKRVGASTILRQKFNDSKITQLQFNASQGQKVGRITANLMVLDPGEIYTTTDPSTALTADDPVLYTEGTGTYKVDTVALSGQSESTIVMDDASSPYYGDDVKPMDVVPGTPAVSVAVTVLVDDNGIQQAYYKRVYGTTTPTGGTKPLKNLDPIGAYEFKLTKATSAGAVTPARSVKLEVPGVKWAPDGSVPHNPDGGAVEINLSGQGRIAGANPMVRTTIECGSAAFTT